VDQIFDICLFANFRAAGMRKKGDFLLNLAIFTQKTPFLRIPAAIKLAKRQKSKI